MCGKLADGVCVHVGLFVAYMLSKSKFHDADFLWPGVAITGGGIGLMLGSGINRLFATTMCSSLGVGVILVQIRLISGQLVGFCRYIVAENGIFYISLPYGLTYAE